MALILICIRWSGEAQKKFTLGGLCRSRAKRKKRKWSFRRAATRAPFGVVFFQRLLPFERGSGDPALRGDHQDEEPVGRPPLGGGLAPPLEDVVAVGKVHEQETLHFSNKFSLCPSLGLL